MLTRKIILGLVGISLLGLLLVSQSLSEEQPQPGQRRGARDQQGQPQPGQRRGAREPQGQPPEGRRFDPEQMQRMMAERMKETLEATDEEWKVIEPRLTTVLNLSRQARGMGRGFFGGPGARGAFGGPVGRGPRGEQGGAAADRPPRPGDSQAQTEVDKSLDELQQAIEKKAAAEEIKNKLTALRSAREKARQQLAKAQKDLREVLSIRQEAQLVLMGTLD